MVKKARTLRLAADLTLPLETVTQTIAVIAKRRAGKSYTARRLAEQFFYAGQQLVIVDPKGDWHGIRAAASGKAGGLPIVILGGEHGDAPLEASAGELVGRLVVEERLSVLLDLSPFRKHEVATFMTAFLETLYRLKARDRYRTPVMLIIDEADAIAPQKPQKGEERMLGAAEDIVRRGGQRGIGCILVTQRSAVLNKNVLTQAQVLIALRTIAPQDLAAMNAWIDVHGTPAERETLMASLPSLPVGDAWVWSPGWPTTDGIFQLVHVLPIQTFDSGASPKPGAKPIEPKRLADVDLKALTRQMADTVARAKENDPKTLRAKWTQLHQTLERVTAERDALAATTTQTTKAEQRELAKVRTQLRDEHARMAKLVAKLQALCTTERSAWEQVFLSMESYSVLMRASIAHHAPAAALPAAGVPPRPAAPRPTPTTTPVPAPTTQPPNPSTEPALVEGERAMLRAIVGASGANFMNPISREHATLLTGYKKSTRNAYLQRLAARDLVTIAGNAILPTAAGVAAAGPVERPPSGRDLVDWWLKKLPAGEATILRMVLEGYTNRADLNEHAPFKKSTRNAYLQRLATRGLVDVDAVAVRPHILLTESADGLH